MSTVPVSAQEERFEWDQHPEGQAAAEPIAPSRSRLVRGALWTIVLLTIGALVLGELHYRMLRGEIARKQATKVSSQLLATRLRDANLLNRYQWVKRSEGLLRIPESLAVSLVIADYSKQGKPTSVVAAAGNTASARVGNGGVP